MAHAATKPAQHSAKRENVDSAKRPEVSAEVKTDAPIATNGTTEKKEKVRYYHPLLSVAGDMTKRADDGVIAAGANFSEGLTIEPTLVFNHSGKKIIKLDSSDFARPQELAQVLADVFERAAAEQRKLASMSDADIKAQTVAADLAKSVGKKLQAAKDSGLSAEATRAALEDMLKNLGLV